jgi:prolyl-tRNA editing enzyme YbaK/EbsC (Cys-tRNA(Pro) deacylase)
MIPSRVRDVLDAHGLRAVEFEAGSCATSELAARRFGVEVSRIAKSLAFLGKDGRLFLVLCPGDRRISSGKLKAATGVKSRMATADETLARTGFSPGGVCPFGVDAGIPIYVDSSLSRYAEIFPAAGTDSSGVPMSYGKLLEVTGGTPGDFLTEPDGDGGPAGGAGSAGE